MKAFKVRGLLCGVLCCAIAGSMAAAPGGVVWAESAGKSQDLDAKVISGEVYVKASSVVNQLGGQGTYDAKSKTYRYTPSDIIPDVVTKVSPSVVAIIGKYTVDSEKGKSSRYDLQHGTGVIVKEDGWIVTNAHVVGGLNHSVVVTSDGKSYSIQKQFLDEKSDLALIKIDATKLKPATFIASNEKLKVGETVVALGTPVSFALRNSATTGVISGVDRGVDSMYKLIQTDAAINPGNSGGALVNLKGEVVGINTLKYAAVGVENMGFSIPADTVQYVLGQFFKYGKVKRASLGFTLEESWAAIVGLPTDEPLAVTRVDSEAAAKAGMKVGDVLYSINGKQVTTNIDMYEALKAYLPGQQVKLMIQSEGDLVNRTLILTEMN